MNGNSKRAATKKLWAASAGASLLLVLMLLAIPSKAASSPILLGVSDSGKTEEYHTWSATLGRRVPVLQTFHTWGTSLRRASARWAELGVRPVLHLSTNGMAAPPSPAAIAAGREDEYLLSLRRQLLDWGQPAFVRPLGEPNRPLNNYSTFLPGGVRRGSEYSPRQYIRAFRRIAILLRSPDVQADLLAMNLPPAALPVSAAGQVSILWSPLPGREGIRGNGPHQFWPGQRWVDAVGTSFFSAWPYWHELQRFQRRWRAWPFWLAEWGLNSGRPRFVSQVYRWCQKRCAAMIYYQGFGDEIYEIDRYPLALRRMQLLSQNTALFPLFAG